MASRPIWLQNSLERLRQIAKAKAIRDENGKVTHEGYPNPAEITVELRRAYLTGKRIAREEGK